MPYTRTGPFVDGGAPGISMAFLNALEIWVLKTPNVSQFGPYTVGTTLTSFNHNLTDGNGNPLTPDLIILQMTGAVSVLRTVVYDDTTLTNTQFKAIGSQTLTFRGYAVKF